MKKNIYEKIIDTYKKNVDEGRIMMYENMSLLMRRNPLLKGYNATYTKEDMLSEAFMLADAIVLKDIPDAKKVSKLWFLFNRGGGVLYNIINQYKGEIYNIDDYNTDERFSELIQDDMLEYILLKNDVISPVEDKVIQYLKQGRGKYEIARLLKTSYQNVKDIITYMSQKIQTFISKLDEDANDSEGK